MGVEVRSPFPCECLAESYAWHRGSTAAINPQAYSLAGFLGALHGILNSSGAGSWGIYMEGELVGQVIFEPQWRAGRLVDGVVHIALARRAWGHGVIQEAARVILPEIWDSHSDLLRISAYTATRYRPGLAVAESLGFTREAVLRDGIYINGQPQDLVLSALTRRDWMENRL